MQNLILYIIGVFFVIGLIDYVLGNKLNLGIHFQEGIKNMGPLALSMVGILSITPILSDLLIQYVAPIALKLGIDISTVVSSIIAVDMGAYKIAQAVGENQSIIYFSGILIASILGCTLSFTLPLALGMIKKEDMTIFCKGILCGVTTVPIGLFIGGILLEIPINIILLNLSPIIIFSVVIIIGLYLYVNTIIKVFTIIGRVIVVLGMIGLSIQGSLSIMGIKTSLNLLPIEESLAIVGKIAIFLGGAYVLIEVLKRILEKKFRSIENKLGVNSMSIAALVGSLASAIIIFSEFENLDDKGKVICTAFSVGGAYVFGGQLGYVAAEANDIVGIYIITKLICGILAVILAMLIINKTTGKDRRKINE